MPLVTVPPPRFRQDADGLVPGPSAAEIAAGKVLRADGTWATGGGGGASSWIDLALSGLFPGGADNSATIQAALDAAHAAGGGTVILPVGSYSIATALTMYADVRLWGQGRYVTTLRALTPNMTMLTYVSATLPPYPPQRWLADVELDGDHKADKGFRVDYAAYMSLDGVTIRKCLVGGFVGKFVLVCQFRQCLFDDCVYGVDLTPDGGNLPNLNTFESCSWGNNSRFGLQIQNADGNHLISCDFESNGDNAHNTTGDPSGAIQIYLRGLASLQPSLKITNGWFESNKGLATIYFTSCVVAIDGMNMDSDDAGCQYGVYCNAGVLSTKDAAIGTLVAHAVKDVKLTGVGAKWTRQGTYATAVDPAPPSPGVIFDVGDNSP